MISNAPLLSRSAGMGKYLVYNHDGTPNNDWTLSTTGTSFFNMPTLADINGDGRLDLVGAGFTAGGSNQTYVYVWNTNQPYNAARTVNPVWQFNVRHNGVYGDNNLVGINETSVEIPDGYLLNQNYPNPFNPVTKISYQLPEAGSVSLQIYNVLGKLVTTLVNERQNSGTFEVQFDGKELSSGVYFYRLNANGISILKMMTLLK